MTVATPKRTSKTTRRARSSPPQPPPVQGVFVLPPRQGRHSLLGIESAFASLRSQHSQFAFEIYGQDGLISYFVRAHNYPALAGILAACYPQAQLADPQEYRGHDGNISPDWLQTAPEEALYMLPLHLKREPYLPLRFYTDQSLARGETDPLASVLGYLSAASMDGRRIGARLLVQPASSKWSQPWQRQLQQRKDRQDLTVNTSTQQSQQRRPSNSNTPQESAELVPGLPTPLILGIAAIGALGYAGYMLYEANQLPWLIAAGAALPLLAGGGFIGYRKLFKQDTVRAYFDEEMAAAKLGAQGFNVELQLLSVLPKRLGKNPAADALEGLAAVYSQFDNQAGNAWEAGKTQLLQPPARRTTRQSRQHLELGPAAASPKHMKRTILSPRELGTIWHLPMGEEEAALMLRAGSRQLRTYLQGVDQGAMVGYAVGSNTPVRISDAVLRRHMLLLGKSGMGKSSLATHIIAGKLRDKANGTDGDALVVIDPHRDLTRDILNLIPVEIADKVRLIDIGNRDRIPAINLLDPKLHRNRDRCVSVVIESLRHLWDNWGPRMHDIMDCCLKTIYEFNDHRSTTREEMLTMLDILPLLAFEAPAGSNGRRPTGPAQLSEFQKKVLQRVSDPDLLMRFERYSRWSEQLRNDAFAPVETRVSGFASDEDPRAIMGQWETTIDFAEVIREGQILLVNTARGTVGPYVSSLMGSSIVSLIDAALREQETMERAQRRNCLLVADEFHSITGANWEDLLAEIRKYGGMVLLITQGLARLDTNERKLKAGVLSNCGGLVCYQMSGEDAYLVVEQMGRDYGLSETDLVGLDPYSAYLKLTVNDVSLPPFSIRTRPPEPANEQAISIIVENMLAYTRDRDDALQQIARRMSRNAGDNMTLRIEDKKNLTNQKISQDLVDQSALSTEIIQQVMSNMDDPFIKGVVDFKTKGKVKSIVDKNLKKVRDEERERFETEVLPQERERIMAEATTNDSPPPPSAPAAPRDQQPPPRQPDRPRPPRDRQKVQKPNTPPPVRRGGRPPPNSA